MLIYRADYNRLWEEVPIMCEHCRNIQTWRKFDDPKDYLACIAYIQQLVEQGEFELIAEESTCPLEKVKTEDGWADEIMAHMIRCKHCGQIFTCVVNTCLLYTSPSPRDCS